MSRLDSYRPFPGYLLPSPYPSTNFIPSPPLPSVLPRLSRSSLLYLLPSSLLFSSPSLRALFLFLPSLPLSLSSSPTRSPSPLSFHHPHSPYLYPLSSPVFPPRPLSNILSPFPFFLSSLLSPPPPLYPPPSVFFPLPHPLYSLSPLISPSLSSRLPSPFPGSPPSPRRSSSLLHLFSTGEGLKREGRGVMISYCRRNEVRLSWNINLCERI